MLGQWSVIFILVNNNYSHFCQAADAISPMASSIHSTKAPRRLWTDPWVSVHLYVANRILGNKYSKAVATSLAEAIVSKVHISTQVNNSCSSLGLHRSS